VSRHECGRLLVDDRHLVSVLKSVIEREREGGCPMACESFAGPALRRWKGYERRNRRNKGKTFDHRVLDLKKGLLAVFPDHGYDESCLAHLVLSFALVPSGESGDSVVEPGHGPRLEDPLTAYGSLVFWAVSRKVGPRNLKG
jgi:hypothetical protein